MNNSEWHKDQSLGDRLQRDFKDKEESANGLGLSVDRLVRGFKKRNPTYISADTGNVSELIHSSRKGH